MSKKLWFYKTSDVKTKATLTNLKFLISSNLKVSLFLQKLDSNWFVDWEDEKPIEQVSEDTIFGEYPYTSKIPKRIFLQIQKVKK